MIENHTSFGEIIRPMFDLNEIPRFAPSKSNRKEKERKKYAPKGAAETVFIAYFAST